VLAWPDPIDPDDHRLIIMADGGADTVILYDGGVGVGAGCQCACDGVDSGDMDSWAFDVDMEIYGEAGNDSFFGSNDQGGDLLWDGGSGNDSFETGEMGAGTETLVGGTGDDTFQKYVVDGYFGIDGGDGADCLKLSTVAWCSAASPCDLDAFDGDADEYRCGAFAGAGCGLGGDLGGACDDAPALLCD
jgi:Ca2+-binding RTX toxin-like protein